MRSNSNDSRTPLERIDGELLRRVIEQSGDMPAPRRGLRRNGREITDDGPSVPWPPVGNRGMSGMSGMERMERMDGPGGGRDCNDHGTTTRRGEGGCGCNDHGTTTRRGEDGCGCNDRTTTRRGESGCGCGEKPESTPERVSWGLYGYPLGMVYAPIQCFGELYDPGEGLDRGTIFRELDLPFTGKGGCRQ